MSEVACLPWDRQHAEGEKAYTYFLLYRDLGRTRTVATVAAEVNKSRNYVHNLARAWRWVQRAQAFDREQDRVYAESMAERRRDMADRHARIAGALQAKIVARLQALDASKLTPTDIGRWLEVATRVERLALGLPDSTTAHTGPDGGPIQAEVTAMGEEQRAAFFRALIAEAQTRAGLTRPGSDDPADEPAGLHEDHDQNEDEQDEEGPADDVPQPEQ